MPRPSARHTAATLAAVAASAKDPATLHVDPALPGLAGVLVLFAAPTTRPTPTALRARFAAALDHARLGCGDPAPGDRYMATLPKVQTPVASLGIAVRVACDDGHRWTHNRTADRASRWTYCAATVTADTVSILGAHTSAEAMPDGRLVIDPDVPHDIAARLRVAYDEARGVVEPSRIIALVAAYLRGIGGRSITSDVYLIPATDPTTCGVLAGLVDLGGWADTVPVADPAKIARLSSPVTKSIEEQIAAVVEDTRAFIARAVDVARPGSTSTLQRRTGDTVRSEIAAARAAASLWRDRLSLASLDVDAALDALNVEADAADAAALAAVEERRAARKLAREIATLTGTTTGADLAAADEAAEVAARRAARAAATPRAETETTGGAV